MNKLQFIEQRNLLLVQKEEQVKAINVEYNRILKEFLKDNSPIEEGKVYELLENGRKRRGFKRFIIYDQTVRMWDETLMITIGGWWLNEKDIPTKWDNMTVQGISNPAVFKISENQTALNHPKSNESN
jgi:hypothetical protein